MKILAVIPARAGSRGVPNKNIRIIGGHPLIWYSIRNAQKSKMITELVISTDSPSVKMIAESMGVKVRWRDASLCQDAVTLDAVIWDAIPQDTKWDYIVTMQCTSPTLRVETLDRAIQYVIDNDLDTVISVTNDPELSWSEKDGKKVPDYAKRLNRQYLPARYVETGAFIIAKASIVTPQTRIGPKMDVFELPDSESQDVDAFSDLISVVATLSMRSVGIYTERPADALELADEFYLKPDIYYDPARTSPEAFGDSKHSIIPVSGREELLRICREKQYSVFIHELGATDAGWMSELRAAMPEAKIVCCDDDGEGAALADLSIDARSHEEYYICPKPYLFFEPVRIREKVQRVLTACGGKLDGIAGKFKGIEFAAATEENRDQWPELMAGCDLAVTEEDCLGRELAVMGLPTVSVGENEAEEKTEKKLQAALELSASARQEMQDELLARGLRNGRKRVMNLINSL